ncbi:prepilin-type N-terminal cleavage/methylation domain-containing protein [Patescibacteria group bacterium]|nr:prepilin-type N-terminal cleavage/methylation domain-containing protein [Patescibacteria group bacterium]
MKNLLPSLLQLTRHKNGFSLVETLVAVSILLLVVVGPLTITSRTAKSSTFSSEQLTAQLLAQEGLELVEKARNDYILENFTNAANGGWDAFTSGSGVFSQCFDTDGCGIDIEDSGDINFPLKACDIAGSPDPCALYQGAAGERARYSHTTGGTLTPFTRTVRFYSTTNPDQIRVESTVTWRTGSLIANQRVELETYLFNVYDR